jgi:hypothetical protein
MKAAVERRQATSLRSGVAPARPPALFYLVQSHPSSSSFPLALPLTPSPLSSSFPQVMKLGEIVEMGKHQELQALGGLYAEMWSKQQATGGDWDGSNGLTGGNKSQAASVNNLPALAAAPGPAPALAPVVASPSAAPAAGQAPAEIQPEQGRFHGHHRH